MHEGDTVYYRFIWRVYSLPVVVAGWIFGIPIVSHGDAPGLRIKLLHFLFVQCASVFRKWSKNLVQKSFAQVYL